MKGKEKCRILKEIRQKIADENGIEYITSECKHKGDCRGTCPKCESEVSYLERELAKRQGLGKRIAIAGIAASLVISGVSCTDNEKAPLEGDIPYTDTETTDGLIPEPENTPSTKTEDEPLMGEPEVETELEGDIPYIDENGNEALGPELPEIMGEIPAYFFPETPEEYDDYSTEFINASLAGMNIDEIKAAWGEEDMNQISGDRGIIAYFTKAQDIIVQYNVETNIVINVTTIENDE
ncbi:MAG: hypothetical protein E7613_00695 [Ruminococcaceae bacterium]|nr:hypothetical protein [Oscillospiraceae bacterium]